MDHLYLSLVLTFSYMDVSAIIPRHRCIKNPNHMHSSKVPCKKFYGIYKLDNITRPDMAHVCGVVGAKLAMPKTCNQIKFMKTLKSVGEFAYVGAKLRDGGKVPWGRGKLEWSDGTLVTSRCSGRGHFVFRHSDVEDTDDLCVVVWNKPSVHKLSVIRCSSKKVDDFICELCLTDSDISLRGKLSHCIKLCVCKNRMYCARNYQEASCPDECTLYQSPPENSETFPVSEFCDLKPCPSYRYGSECQFQCFCKDSQPCHQDSGQCPGSGGCAPGWSGPSCNQTECSEIGRWGNSCEKPCSCASGQQCDKKTGTCFIGYVCPPGQFGPHCESKCFCKDGGECTRWKGICLNGQCADGWEGASCDNRMAGHVYSKDPRWKIKRDKPQECPPDKWGPPGCHQNCSKACAFSCDWNFGICLSIAGNTTLGDCEPGKWGAACEESCSDSCDSKGCDKTSGECFNSKSDGDDDDEGSGLYTLLWVFLGLGLTVILLVGFFVTMRCRRSPPPPPGPPMDAQMDAPQSPEEAPGERGVRFSVDVQELEEADLASLRSTTTGESTVDPSNTTSSSKMFTTRSTVSSEPNMSSMPTSEASTSPNFS